MSLAACARPKRKSKKVLDPGLSSVSHCPEGLPFTRFSLSGQMLFWHSLSFWFTFLGNDLPTHNKGGCPYLHRSGVLSRCLSGWLLRRWMSIPCRFGIFSTQPVISSAWFGFCSWRGFTTFDLYDLSRDFSWHSCFHSPVPATRLTDLQAELTTWQAASFFTKKQLQSVLGKLSFVTACVKPGRIFVARLLNSLRECKRPAGHRYPISANMLLDIQWWLTFLPQFDRVSFMKPSFWDFESLNSSTDACLHGGGATCRTECISSVFPDCSSPSTLHINALNFSRLLLLSSIGRFSCQDASSLSRAIILLQSRSSILPPPRTLSCSVASDNFGSPLLFSILKCVHCIFRANTISLRIVWVAGTQMLQLVTVFIVCVVTLISFSIFKLSNLRVFLSMLRDHICLFCFIFLFVF